MPCGQSSLRLLVMPSTRASSLRPTGVISARLFHASGRTASTPSYDSTAQTQSSQHPRPQERGHLPRPRGPRLTTNFQDPRRVNDGARNYPANKRSNKKSTAPRIGESPQDPYSVEPEVEQDVLIPRPRNAHEWGHERDRALNTARDFVVAGFQGGKEDEWASPTLQEFDKANLVDKAMEVMVAEQMGSSRRTSSSEGAVEESSQPPRHHLTSWRSKGGDGGPPARVVDGGAPAPSHLERMLVEATGGERGGRRTDDDDAPPWWQSWSREDDRGWDYDEVWRQRQVKDLTFKTSLVVELVKKDTLVLKPISILTVEDLVSRNLFEVGVGTLKRRGSGDHDRHENKVAVNLALCKRLLDLLDRPHLVDGRDVLCLLRYMRERDVADVAVLGKLAETIVHNFAQLTLSERDEILEIYQLLEVPHRGLRNLIVSAKRNAGLHDDQ